MTDNRREIIGGEGEDWTEIGASSKDITPACARGAHSIFHDRQR